MFENFFRWWFVISFLGFVWFLSLMVIQEWYYGIPRIVRKLHLNWIGWFLFIGFLGWCAASLLMLGLKFTGWLMGV